MLFSKNILKQSCTILFSGRTYSLKRDLCNNIILIAYKQPFYYSLQENGHIW